VRKALFILSLFLSFTSLAQSTGDSLQKSDSGVRKKDSSSVRRVRPNILRPKNNVYGTRDSISKARDSIHRDSVLQSRRNILRDSLSRDSVKKDSAVRSERAVFFTQLDSAIYNRNPFYRFNDPERLIMVKRQWKGKEGFFYSIIALLLFFALAKNTFSRYLDDLFRVFFRTTLKQRQTRDQLMSAPLPSLLFNILYALSAALFITLLLQHFHLGEEYDFWVLFLYSIAGLIVVYTIKFLALKLFGWILGITEATNTYIFIVFTTNKVIGILLLPFIVGLAFTDTTFYEIVFSLSLCLVASLFVYRFYLSFMSVRKQISINFFHFLLYIVAFEIVPLLLINKLLVSFFSETH
jgi:hypothetical protein